MYAGYVLALAWLLPFVSVRNLMEFICTPPLLLGYYCIYRAEENEAQGQWLFWAGICFGLAFALRIQTIIIAGCIGVLLLLTRHIRSTAVFTAGFVVAIFSTLGMVDWIFNGWPFASVYDNSVYNLKNYGHYPHGPHVMYFGILLMGFILPTSLVYAYGFLKTWKKYYLLFWPVIVFIVFHSFFPNRQERFILPIVPLVVVFGVVGTYLFVAELKFWQRHHSWFRGLNIWFWIINTALLLVVSTTYSKKSRVETLTFLSKREDVRGLIIERNNRGIPSPPLFYLHKKVPVYLVQSRDMLPDIKRQIVQNGEAIPNYVILLEGKNIDQRLQCIETAMGVQYRFIAKISPTFIDALLYKLNPGHNVNETSFVYSQNDDL